MGIQPLGRFGQRPELSHGINQEKNLKEKPNAENSATFINTLFFTTQL